MMDDIRIWEVLGDGAVSPGMYVGATMGEDDEVRYDLILYGSGEWMDLECHHVEIPQAFYGPIPGAAWTIIDQFVADRPERDSETVGMPS